MRRAEEVTPELLRSWALPEPAGDKSDRGDVHVVGGEPSTPGAVLLAGIAALRVGAGRLVISTGGSASALGVAVPEAAVRELSELDSCPCPDVFVIGPGLSAPEGLVAKALSLHPDVGLVVDAGALDELPSLPSRTVLTPNGRELRALAGTDDGEVDRLAAQVAAERQVVVAAAGWVAAPDGRLWHDGTGSVALATSGSGDVLAGAVGGLLARGADPDQAACWGLHLHATAGQLLVPQRGRVGLLARELLDQLPVALAGLC
ncbi:MAG: NAD(P)H-hydrate dehydratase [Frankiales bacterium]|nr:NAD(P)H-hydrate dehydratase [Frankiales bacterium]